MKNFIVITSIFPPTEAVRSFSMLEGYRLVVVGVTCTRSGGNARG